MSRFHGLSAVVPLGLPKGMPGLQWVSEQGGGLRVDGYDGYDARARFADQVQRSSLVGEGVKSSKFSQEVVFVRHVSNVSRGRAPYIFDVSIIWCRSVYIPEMWGGVECEGQVCVAEVLPTTAKICGQDRESRAHRNVSAVRIDARSAAWLKRSGRSRTRWTAIFIPQLA